MYKSSEIYKPKIKGKKHSTKHQPKYDKWYFHAKIKSDSSKNIEEEYFI